MSKKKNYLAVGLDWLKKYQWDLVLGLVLVVVFFASRLISLTDLPIFVDEAIYLRWAQIAKNDSNWRFISLTDGKQPIFVWLVMMAMRFVKDPIFAGRLVSVLAGLGSMAVLWVLSFFLFKSRRLAHLSALFYLVSPFALVYDRMALMDALVAFFSLLSLLMAVLLVKTRRLDVALIFGAVLGGGLLTKTSGFLSIYLLPLTVLLFDYRDKKRLPNFIAWVGLAALASAIAVLFYSILRLSPFFHIISEKNALFVYPLWEWMKDPFYYFVSNFKGMTNWLVLYLTVPWVILAVFSLGTIRLKIKEKMLLFLWFLAPFMGLIIFGRILYPRFVFFMSMPLLILVSFSVVRVWGLAKKIWLKAIFLIFIFAWPLYASYAVLYYPSQAPIPVSDRAQYVTSWPAGHGIKEIILFAEREAKNQEIFIATEGTFGLMPASLELYLWDHPNITIKGYFPINEFPFELVAQARKMPTYIVFNETQNPPGKWPIKLIAKYLRPDSRYSMKLYQVVEPPFLTNE